MLPKVIRLLAIESSCDDTAAAVLDTGKILSHGVVKQMMHQTYGGVVPELAARAHQRNLLPLVQQVLHQAQVTPAQLHAVAFTQGPGLLGALLVGASFAKAFAWACQLPLLGIHHMQAHVLANFIDAPTPSFPFLCLTVSGGHTQLVLVRDYLDMALLGETQDDAVGEAFDKIATMMGIPYPGGPRLDQYAQQGDPHRFSFPVTVMPNLDFSFSGIKTAFLYFLRKQGPDFVAQYRSDLCASIQATLIEMLLAKVKKAVGQTGIRTVALAGGVAANSGLRKQLQHWAAAQGVQLFIPALAYCTDNAAMIAMAAYFQYRAGNFCTLEAGVFPKMPLNT